MMGMKDLSVIIPVFNEEDNIQPLCQSLYAVLSNLPLSWEVVFVDDGSVDATFSRLHRLSYIHPYLNVVQLSRNFGQTAAMRAGIAHSSGDVLVFMDGDLQNDPRDIPRLLAKLEEGYDVVSGWRKQRQDPQLLRKLPSRIANRLISRITKVAIHDYGCTLKAYRRHIFDHIRLYGEMHRFIPAYAALVGARVTELEVTHHPRRFGVSKYGLSRTTRVLLDLLTLKFLGSFGTKPIYAFGSPGIAGITFGLGLLHLLLVRKFFPRVPIGGKSLLPLASQSISFGIQCILMGLLAELLMRTYHESQNKSTYIVRELIAVSHIEPEAAQAFEVTVDYSRQSSYKAPAKDDQFFIEIE